MNNTRLLRDIGQSLWLDNITREILDNGTLRQYVDDYAITGLTSNPTIFDEAIGGTKAYDASIRSNARYWGDEDDVPREALTCGMTPML